MVVPAALYVLQNNLLFLALSNLDSATYQVKLAGNFYFLTPNPESQAKCSYCSYLQYHPLHHNTSPVIGLLSDEDIDHRLVFSVYVEEEVALDSMVVTAYPHYWCCFSSGETTESS